MEECLKTRRWERCADGKTRWVTEGQWVRCADGRNRWVTGLDDSRYNLSSRGMAMPRWIVGCAHCKKEFAHTEIAAIITRLARDTFASPPKPQISESGTELMCPHCNKTSAYRVSDLRLRKD